MGTKLFLALKNRRERDNVASLENEVLPIQRKDGRVVCLLHGLKDLVSRPLTGRKE